ncbi:MAG: MATE family efflux transporter [Spirochaetaceae bacterium]|nr:MATE family efflux transporter [Spirochaetaceae bacterium]
MGIIDTNADSQFKKMTETPVSRLIVQLAIPTVISMLVTAIYNMADTFFVSRINTQSSAAVGIVFPIMSIIQACGFTLGMGSGSLVSRRLGEKKNDEASCITSTAFFTAIGIGLVITILGNAFSNSFLKLVGASDSVLPYAASYAEYIFFGAPFMCAAFVLNNVLRSEGKAFFSMIALTSGGILNIFLDPLFICGFKMGISGAAIATLISQLISFSILLSWFLRKKAICRISISLYTKEIRILGLIIATGLPSLARQGLASIAAILLNRSAGVYGDAAVAGMSIVTKIVMFIASMMIGIGQGFTPVSGYNYGAKRYDRVKSAYRFTVCVGFCVMLFFSAPCFIFAKHVISSFIADLTAIAIGTTALRWQVAVLPLHSLIVTTNMLMQSTGKIKSATFLSMNRQGVYFIPAILILPRLLGLTGVEVSQAVADLLSVLTAVPYMLHFFRHLGKN